MSSNKDQKKIGRPRTAAQIPIDFPVNLIAVPENSVDFQVRKNEVQCMLVGMILRGRIHINKKKKPIKSK
jgi:hypothetical protein